TPTRSSTASRRSTRRCTARTWRVSPSGSATSWGSRPTGRWRSTSTGTSTRATPSSPTTRSRSRSCSCQGTRTTSTTGSTRAMRQFAGFGGAEETNGRFRYLLEHGQTGLSTAFDMPTLMGYDSDHPLALGEVGREGVAVDSLADVETLFAGIPLGEVSTSMTINSPAAMLLAFYACVGEEQGVPVERLRGTVQTDILKEYIAQKEWIFPPEPSMRLVVDMIEWCAQEM